MKPPKRGPDTIRNLYAVSELFQTIQGEASNAGTPSFFVRLQGCPVGCPWCDTKYTWDLSKANDRMSADSIVSFGMLFNSRHAVITGGEPLAQDCDELIDEFIRSGFTVQIETSGTYPLPRKRSGLFVTVSPKWNMPGGLRVIEQALNDADEIKMPVGKMRDIELLISNLSDKSCKNVWLQPLSQNKSATALCVQAAQKNNWRLSIQTHKYIGIE